MLHSIRRCAALRPSNSVSHPLSTVLSSDGQISILDRDGLWHGGDLTRFQRIDHRLSVPTDHSILSSIRTPDCEVYAYRFCSVCARRVGEFLKSRTRMRTDAIPECAAQCLRVDSTYTSGLLITTTDTSQNLHLLYAHRRRPGGSAGFRAPALPTRPHLRPKYIESDRRDHDPKFPRNEPGCHGAQHPFDSNLLAPCLGVSQRNNKCIATLLWSQGGRD